MNKSIPKQLRKVTNKMRTKENRLIRLFIELNNWDAVWDSDREVLSRRPAKARRILKHLRHKAINAPYDTHSCEGITTCTSDEDDDHERPVFYIYPDGQRTFLSAPSTQTRSKIGSVPLTKLEKLNKELEKWAGLTDIEEEDLRKYPAQSRKVLKAMRKLLRGKSEGFWQSHSLVCPELGIHVCRSSGFLEVCNVLPAQRKSDGFSILVVDNNQTVYL